MARFTALGIWLALAVVFSSRVQGQGFAEPTAEHQILADMVGEWETTMKVPGAPDAKGSATFTSECNGLWICSDFKTDLGGQDFRGRGIDGYDAAQKKYVSIWVDSMGTAPMIFHGSYDAKTMKLTMTADAAGPDGQPAKWKSVSSNKDKDHHTFEMYITPSGGEESLMMTIEYARKK